MRPSNVSCSPVKKQPTFCKWLTLHASAHVGNAIKPPMASAAFRGASRRFMVLEVALVTMNQRVDSE